MKSSQSNL